MTRASAKDRRAKKASVLDVTGCAHLFGGEVGLVYAAHQRAGRIGLTVKSALASTSQATRALARFGAGGLFAAGEDRQAVRGLPVAALELPVRDAQALQRAGLKRIADLDDRPRAPLAARFGTDFPARLARVLGDEDLRITPYRPTPPINVDRVFEPILTDTDVERVLSDLLVDAADRLDQAGQGGRAFEAGFYRVDGQVRRIVVRTGRATRDVEAMLRLFRERLFEQFRREVMAARLMEVEGVVEKSPEGVVHLVARKVIDRSSELTRLSEDHDTTVQLARADVVANPQPPRNAPHRHPRDVRILPGSRDFH